MSSVTSKSEIFSKVQEALVDALGVDEDEVTPQATLQGDLGAESIDFLDIVFRLEKAFGIKIERGELFPEDILTNTEYVEDGKVNAAGLAKLKERMPFADLLEIRRRPERAKPRPSSSPCKTCATSSSTSWRRSGHRIQIGCQGVAESDCSVASASSLCNSTTSQMPTMLALHPHPASAILLMRWFWLDRFTEFVSGSHATAVKCVSLSEDHLQEHLPGYPIMPNTLVAEGMAQCGGLLVSEIYQFSELVVLAKFANCTIEGEARPGDTSATKPSSNKRKISARRSSSKATSTAARFPKPKFSSPASIPNPPNKQRPRPVQSRSICYSWLHVGRRVRNRRPPRRHPPPRRRLPALSQTQIRNRFNNHRDTEDTEKNQLQIHRMTDDRIANSAQ